MQYHAAYEKTKGTKIEVANDPEMERHKKNMQVRAGRLSDAVSQVWDSVFSFFKWECL